MIKKFKLLSDRYKKIDKVILIKLLILIILILIIMIISFKTGEKFYILQNTNNNMQNADVSGDIVRWNFNVRVFCDGKEVDVYESN